MSDIHRRTRRQHADRTGRLVGQRHPDRDVVDEVVEDVLALLIVDVIAFLQHSGVDLDNLLFGSCHVFDGDKGVSNKITASKHIWVSFRAKCYFISPY